MDLSKYKHLFSKENTIDCTTNFSNLLAHVKNINNEEEFCKEEVCSIVNNINQLLETIIEKGSLSDYAPLLEFVKARLKLTLVKKQDRKYSNKLLTVSFLWQMTSPKLYETLKELFILPSVCRIQQLSSIFAENVERLNQPYLEARLKALSETEKLVMLTCDEINTAKRLEYFNGSVFGMTENGEIAKTVLCFMVQSLCFKYKDVVGLTAVAGLNPYVSLLAVPMDNLSTSRPTMIKYGISNIRDLFGPRVDLQKVYDNPLCRLGAGDDQNEAETSISSSDRPSIDLLLLEKRLDRLIVRLSIAKSRLEGCEDKFCEQLREKNRKKVEAMEVQQLQSCQKYVLSRAPVSKTSLAPAKMKLDLTNSLGLSLAVPSDCCGDDLVLWCDPRSPPLDVVVLLAILDSAGSIGIASLVHSSLGCIADEVRANLMALFCSKSQHDNTTLGTREKKRCRRVTVVWKNLDGRTDCLMPVGQRACILGEGSTARFISDAIESEPKNSVRFCNPSDASSTAMADDLVERCRRGSSTKEIIGCVSSLLKTSAGPMLFGSQLSLADVMTWSTLTKIKSCREHPPVVQTWYKHCTQLPEFSNALTNN